MVSALVAVTGTDDAPRLPAPAAMLTSSLQPQFGKYRLLDVLGMSGMATVYLASLEGLGGFKRKCALKVIHPHLTHDESYIRRFVNEARLGGFLQHQHIVQTLEFGDEQGCLFLAMEYGNVGIGTTAPSAALDIARSGTNDPIALFGSTGPTDEQALTVKNGSGGISLFAQGGNGTFLTGATQGDVGIRFTADDDFHIGQSREALLTIKSGGNVGIGTTSPLEKLQIEGNPDWRRQRTAGAECRSTTGAHPAEDRAGGHQRPTQC